MYCVICFSTKYNIVQDEYYLLGTPRLRSQEWSAGTQKQTWAAPIGPSRRAQAKLARAKTTSLSARDFSRASGGVFVSWDLWCGCVSGSGVCDQSDFRGCIASFFLGDLILFRFVFLRRATFRENFPVKIIYRKLLPSDLRAELPACRATGGGVTGGRVAGLPGDWRQRHWRQSCRPAGRLAAGRLAAELQAAELPAAEIQAANTIRGNIPPLFFTVKKSL